MHRIEKNIASKCYYVQTCIEQCRIKLESKKKYKIVNVSFFIIFFLQNNFRNIYNRSIRIVFNYNTLVELIRYKQFSDSFSMIKIEI